MKPSFGPPAETSPADSVTIPNLDATECDPNRNISSTYWPYALTHDDQKTWD